MNNGVTTRQTSHPAQTTLRAGELARVSGVSVETLRYYERLGLIPSPMRSPGGQRRYHHDAVLVMQVIKSAQRLGFSLTEIAELFASSDANHPEASSADFVDRREARLADVEQRIDDLRVIRETLENATGSSTPPDQAPVPFAAMIRQDDPTS